MIDSGSSVYSSYQGIRHIDTLAQNSIGVATIWL